MKTCFDSQIDLLALWISVKVRSSVRHSRYSLQQIHSPSQAALFTNRSEDRVGLQRYRTSIPVAVNNVARRGLPTADPRTYGELLYKAGLVELSMGDLADELGAWADTGMAGCLLSLHVLDLRGQKKTTPRHTPCQLPGRCRAPYVLHIERMEYSRGKDLLTG